jgi:hypothetical protein
VGHGPVPSTFRFLPQGLTRIPVEADAENQTAGNYVLAEKLAKVRGENAIAYCYDWVPNEELEYGDSAADETPDDLRPAQAT